MEGPDSSLLQEKGEFLISIFEDMEKGLEIINKSYKERNIKYILKGEKKLKVSIKKLSELKKNFKETFHILFHRSCFNCGHDNYSELKHCEECGNQLNRIIDDYDIEEEPDKEMDDYERAFPRGIMLDTSILNIIYKGEQFYFSSITAEELERELAAFEVKLSSFEEKIKEIKVNVFSCKKVEVIFKELKGKTLEAINEIRLGLESLRKYMRAREKEDFLFSIKKIAAAGGFLHRLQDLCEVCERQLAAIV